ncbi:MAG: DUF4191 domain-containing protein [Bifidobacteriaceae bacterium]|nr:DUF4191 domain-containing protein [Bifidobacteriaceae bacterium]
MPKTNPDGSQKQGTIAKFKQIYQYTKEGEPRIGLYLVLAIIGGIVISIPFMFLFNNFIYPEIFGLLTGAIAAMLILSRIADRVGYDSVVGKTGAAGAVLNTITQSNWSFATEPVAVNQSTRDLVYRGIGRAGIVLVTEGPVNRVRPLVKKEEQKVKRVIPNITVTQIYSGESKDQVSVRKLRKTILKLKPVLTKAELDQVKTRMKALGTFNLPIPKGIDPMKVRPTRKIR